MWRVKIIQLKTNKQQWDNNHIKRALNKVMTNNCRPLLPKSNPVTLTLLCTSKSCFTIWFHTKLIWIWIETERESISTYSLKQKQKNKQKEIEKINPKKQKGKLGGFKLKKKPIQKEVGPSENLFNRHISYFKYVGFQNHISS